MSIPTGKVSKRRSRQRAAHHALSPRNLRPCARCGQQTPAHRVCPKCGYYRGRAVVDKGD
jgi:large subunit ribosomal protein L32